jgi:D-proline reductase (dithiol) PrdB
VCHQTVSLVARYLEENGIATVVIGSARDIVEECGVPRFLFTDFPLGNPCGRPGDEEMQRAILGLALDLLEKAWCPAPPSRRRSSGSKTDGGTISCGWTTTTGRHSPVPEKNGDDRRRA